MEEEIMYLRLKIVVLEIIKFFSDDKNLKILKEIRDLQSK